MTIDEEIDALVSLRVKYEEWQKKPHEYVATRPYRGCSICGFGEGAYFHNSFNVAQHRLSTHNE